MDTNGLPVRVLITEGAQADCKEVIPLIEGIATEILLTDLEYDTNHIIASAVATGIKVAIPAK